MMEHKRNSVSLDQSSLMGLTKKIQKIDAPLSSKEKKEKVGERISALQQLVSPYGKTDTASVLLEAMEYIRFLHEQVKVLSAPYLSSTPTTNTQVSIKLVHHSMFGWLTFLLASVIMLVPI
ncbi:transcription factor bHLH153-like isoform X2 [Olea europaea subsp. europaea]|uniref:Transcription factor bHLH153-like isoform X2 n=1 Tax=Olea europaea subsp. europaea TaxID=158383 RepID=A0A8S0SYW2_OLEEU|nr:transcription factor bHLH153-like isoform X2 [Olea europaea subsp. europaea]